MSELTKKALAVSLKKLLSKKELSKITISNITDECGVNRQTFYYHFKDIYDLLEWIYKNEVIDEIDNKDEEWQQRFLYIFKYVLKNKEFVKNTYNSISREYLLRFIYMQTNKLLIDFIDKESEGMNIKVEDKKLFGRKNNNKVVNMPQSQSQAIIITLSLFCTILHTIKQRSENGAFHFTHSLPDLNFQFYILNFQFTL